MKIQEQTQIDDFKAQYNSILGNIAVANTELESKLKNNNLALEQYESICTNIQLAIDKHDEILKETERITNDANARMKSVATAEEQLNNAREEFITFRDKELIEIKSKKVHLDAEVSDMHETINTYQSQIRELESDIENRSYELQVINEEVGSLTKTRNDLSKSITELQDSSEQVLKSIESKIKEKTTELIELNRLVEEEKEKIAGPLRLISEENAKLDRKKRNLDILITRFRKEFVKLYPDTEIKI